MKSLLLPHQVKVPLRKGQWINTFWDDWVVGAQFEPSVQVKVYSAMGTSTVGNPDEHDPEVYWLNGVLRAAHWKPTLTELSGRVEMFTITSLLTFTGGAQPPPAQMTPPPPSGLVPPQPSFPPISSRVMPSTPTDRRSLLAWRQAALAMRSCTMGLVGASSSG